MQACWENIGKAKAQLKLQLGRDVKRQLKKTAFHKYVRSKRKAKQSIVPCLNAEGDRVMEDVKKVGCILKTPY